MAAKAALEGCGRGAGAVAFPGPRCARAPQGDGYVLGAVHGAACGKAHSKAAAIKDAAFKWEDPLDLEGELTEEERMVRDTARDYAQEKLFPRVLKAFRKESYDRP